MEEPWAALGSRGVILGSHRLRGLHRFLEPRVAPAGAVFVLLLRKKSIKLI